MTEEPPSKKTENETANHLIDIALENEDKTIIQVRLIFAKETSVDTVIAGTKKFISAFKEYRPEKTKKDGFT